MTAQKKKKIDWTKPLAPDDDGRTTMRWLGTLTRDRYRHAVERTYRRADGTVEQQDVFLVDDYGMPLGLKNVPEENVPEEAVRWVNVYGGGTLGLEHPTREEARRRVVLRDHLGFLKLTFTEGEKLPKVEVLPA